MRKLLTTACAVLWLAAPASGSLARLMSAGKLRLPALPSMPLTMPAGLAQPRLLSAPMLNFGLSSFPAPAAIPQVRFSAPVELKVFKGVAKVGFFYNDHNASASYLGELAQFVRRHDEVLVESLEPGPNLEAFQSVADGARTPAQALRLLRGRAEPMDAAVLEALYGSGVRVLPESVHARGHTSVRRRIDEKLLPEASEHLSSAYEKFLEDGDAAGAAADLEKFNALMAEVHALREESLVKDLERRLGRKRAKSVGVIFGMFHTQPYHELRRRGYEAQREFHPAPARGGLRMVPYNRPLRAARFGKRYGDADESRRDTLSLLLFYAFLDRVYRMDKFPAEQTGLYNAIAARMAWADWELLANDLSIYFSEHGPEAAEDGRVARFMLRWLEEEGFLSKAERGFFRYR
ncbi:MAG: hypothetical protein ABIJ96_15675 [Elusimicrobiota bacterium]